MKKLFKTGLVVLIIGLIALGVGYFNGGNKTISFNGTRPTVITNHVRRLSNKEFSRLKLNVSTADVVIKQGKKYQVTYYGMAGQLPTAKRDGKTLTITQKGNAVVSFKVNGDSDQDMIVITVPQGHSLAGNIHLISGDLSASNVDLSGATVKVTGGDVDYRNVTLAKGKTSLEEGDFTAKQLRVNGHYTVDNDEGDNTVLSTSADGYHLYTDDGDNSLNGEDKGDETLNQNENATNVLNLITSEGDNEVN